MLLKSKESSFIPSSEITPESQYLGRREFLAAAGLLGVGALSGLTPLQLGAQQDPQPVGKPFGLQKDDKATPWTDVTTYNNFYEFGTGKEDPAENAKNFKPLPWTVSTKPAPPATAVLGIAGLALTAVAFWDAFP